MSRDAKEGDEDHSWRVIVVTTVCLAISVGIVGLRLYVRRFLIRNLGVDDWFLVATLLLYTVCAMITSVSKRALPVQLIPGLIVYEAIKFGLSRHDSTVSFSEKIEFLKLMWIASIGYGGVIVLLKTTFLLQYRRAFPLQYFQVICKSFLYFIAMWAIGGTIGALLNCQPFEQNWDPILYKSCRSRYNFWFAMGILHVLTDVAIFALPLQPLMTLSLPTLQKGVLIGIFSLGFFACTISIIRLTTLRASTQGDDLTWTMQNTVMWSVAEIACGIICACIPTLRPLLPRFKTWQRFCNNIDELSLTPRSEESNMCHRGAQ